MTPINLQTNTFVEGLNLDSNISYMKDSQYRDAQNVRVIADNNGTTGSLQNIEGISKLSNEIGQNEIIVATDTSNDISAVITKTVDDNNQYLYNTVYTLQLNSNNTAVITNKVLKADLSLGYGDNWNLPKIVINQESNTNIKLYIADSKNMIRVIDLTSDKYKETDPQNELLDANGLVKDTSAFDIIPGAVLPSLQLVRMEEGNLESGMVQYCYQLFNVRGIQTEISPLSGMIHLTQSNSSDTAKYYEGSNKGDSSKKACVLRAQLISSDFDRCRIIRIFYDENNNIPKIDIVDEIPVYPAMGYIEYIDRGVTKLGELTIEQFNATNGSMFKASVIAKMNNRLFAANITEDSWNPKYDARAYRCNKEGVIKLESNSGGSTIEKNVSTLSPEELQAFYESIPEDHDCINPFNLSKDAKNNWLDTYQFDSLLVTDYRYRRKGGRGPNISYTFVRACTYEGNNISKGFMLDDIFYNSVEVGITGEPKTIEGVAYVNMDSENDVVQYKEKIDLGSAVLTNYADPVLSSRYRTYQRDEVYRFGIVFYNSKGIASPVHWIGDIRMPDAYDKGFAPFYPANDGFYARPLGIHFEVKNLPKECVAYEIVRCDRTQNDRTVVMQTAVSILGNHSEGNADRGLIGGNSDTRPPLYLYYADKSMKFKNQGEYTGEIGVSELAKWQFRYDVFNLVSPEICLMKDKAEGLINNTSYIQPVYGLCSIMDYGNDINTSDSVYIARQSKYVKSTYEGIGWVEKKYRFPDKGHLGQITNLAPQSGPIADWDAWDESQAFYIDNLSDNWDAEGQPLAGLIFKYYVPFQSQNPSIPTGLTPGTDIKKVIYPKELPYNFPSQDVNLASYYSTIGNYQYLNIAETNFSIGRPNSAEMSQKEGAHGPCLVAQIPGLVENTPLFTELMNTYGQVDVSSLDLHIKRKRYALGSVLIANVKKNTVQYGGDTYVARQNSIYITTGQNKQKANSDNSTSFVFGGDTYLCLLDYPVTTIFQAKGRNDNNRNKAFIGAYIPFETTVNLNLTFGHEVHRTFNESNDSIDIFAQIEPGQMSDYHIQDKAYYAYNDAYSAVSTVKKYIPSALYNIDDKVMPNRITVSEPKTNDEIYDSWASFKFANYLDVDNQYGQITNLKVFKNQLMFWQNNSLGIASVNERSLINDNNVGALTLGTGDILSRYDYLTTTNGSSVINDKSIVTSDNVLYWYDGNKKELCSFTGQVSSLSKEKQVQSWFNKFDREVTNSVFDKKYNEIWFVSDKSLVFNEQLGRFTSFYTFTPQHTLSFSDMVIGIEGTDTYKINDRSNRGSYFGSEISKISFLVNKDPVQTKVFDNVLMSGEFVDGSNSYVDAYNNIVTNVDFYTLTQHAKPFSSVDYREDTYRFAVGRADNSINKIERMRGKYLQCDYTFDCSNGKHFELPYINTTYRYSLV